MAGINKLWVLTMGLLAGVPAVAQKTSKMNVLFIVVDDLRPLLGCYGDARAMTPHIDSLAAGARVFDRAYCQQAVCAPSRASFMTGRRPDQLRIWGLSQPLRALHPGIATLPQHFKNNGYITAAAGKIYHDPPAHHDPASWTWPAVYGVTGNGMGTKYALPENAGKAKAAATEVASVADTGYIDGKVAVAAVDMLGRLKGQPFFLAVGFRRPHLPFSAPRRYWDAFAGKPLPPPDTTVAKGAPAIAFHRSEELRGYTDMPKEGALSAEQSANLLQGYYAAVSYVDAQVGLLLKALDDHGLRHNTIVVLLSDHGFHLGEQGMWAKSTNFEAATRVPLIIRAPGTVRAPGHASAIVELVDLYPTLAELCGLPIPEGLAGNSITPVLRDAGKSVKQQALSQFIRPYGALMNDARITHMGYSLRTEKFRYTAWYDFSTRKPVAAELYELSVSRIETVNLAGDPRHAQAVQALERRLQAMIAP